ncbi:MAG: serine hydrolase [Bacteroidota bacterium]
MKFTVLAALVLVWIHPIQGQSDKAFPQTATPAEVGLHSDSIQTIIDTFDRRSIVDFRSFIIIKDQKLVTEAYYNSYWRETIHDIRSAGKSITALLMGVAIQQGLVKDEEQLVADFFPEQIDPDNPAFKNLRIRHLLMMSSGLDADSDDGNSRGNAGNWMGGDQWVETILGLSRVFEPGEKWVYADACAVLCGAIIQQTSGLTLSEFAEKHLFNPLQIREYYWYKNAAGVTGAAGNLYLRNLDFAKLGLLLLNKGEWQGQQLFSEKWAEALVKPRLEISEVGPLGAAYYGYFWYIGTYELGEKSYTYYFATGNGGNRVYVVPELNMVVAAQSSAHMRGYGHRRAHFVLQSAIRAVEN